MRADLDHAALVEHDDAIGAAACVMRCATTSAVRPSSARSAADEPRDRRQRLERVVEQEQQQVDGIERTVDV